MTHGHVGDAGGSQHQPTGRVPRRPVFVVGASRSGTALLRSALNRHPHVFLTGETHYFDDLRTRLAGRGQPPLSAEEHTTCQDYFLALGHRPYGHAGDPERSGLDRARLTALAEEFGSGGDAYFEAYCLLARDLEPGASPTPSIWGEKTPRHVFRLPEIMSRYPEARVVCMYRDPRAVVASYRDWRNQGGFDLDADEGHREALGDEAGRTRASYDPTVASLLWKGTVAAGVRAQTRFGDERVRLVRYEDLATAPETSLRSISAWLGLDFDDRMLDVPMHNSSFSAFTATAGVSSAPVTRWRSVLSASEIATVQLWCSAEVQRLGYDLEQVSLSPAVRARTYARVPVSLLRALLANRARMGRIGPYLWRRLRLLLPS
jgi:hypothetical protein